MIRQGKLANTNKDTGSWLWGSRGWLPFFVSRRKTGKKKEEEAKSAGSLIKRKGRIRFQKMEWKSIVGRRAGERVQPCPVIL